MKQFSKQFHSKAQEVSLTSTERKLLRERVVSYIEYHPLANNSQSKRDNLTKKQLGYESAPFAYITIPFKRYIRHSVVFSVLLVTLIPVVAESALPGDVLYPVKVNFTEELISTVTIRPHKKIEWETERLNRRIVEAKLLVESGRLDESVEMQIADAVREHTTAVVREIEELRKTDVDGANIASIELASTLELQSTSLKSLMTERNFPIASGDEMATSGHILGTIEETLPQTREVADNALPSFEKVSTRVDINTARAADSLQSLQATIDADSYAELSRRLDDIKRLAETAQASRSENEALALEQMITALQNSQKLIVFITGPVRYSAALEESLPVIPTPQENEQRLVALSEEIEETTTRLENLSESAPQEIVVKIQFALQTVAENKDRIANKDDIPSSVQIAEELVATLRDALVLAEREGLLLEVPEVSAPVLEESTSTDTATTSSEIQ